MAPVLVTGAAGFIGCAVAHAGLGREVDDELEAMAREQRVHGRGIGEIDLGEGEARVRQPREAGALQRGVVIIGEVVESDDFAALGQQAERFAAWFKKYRRKLDLRSANGV